MTLRQKRIGILGGTFDPVHSAHIQLALDACHEVALDEVRFIPVARSPFKVSAPEVSDAHRIAMLEIALAAYPSLVLDLFEIKTAKQPSYSVDTMRYLRTQNPDAIFFWILGEDHLEKLPSWHEAELLASWVTFVVFARPGYDFNASALPSWINCINLRGEYMDISATGIRNQLAKGSLPYNHLPDSVAGYIRTHALYT